MIQQQTISVNGEQYLNFFAYNRLQSYLREGWIVKASWINESMKSAWFLLEMNPTDREEKT